MQPPLNNKRGYASCNSGISRRIRSLQRPCVRPRSATAHYTVPQALPWAGTSGQSTVKELRLALDLKSLR